MTVQVKAGSNLKLKLRHLQAILQSFALCIGRYLERPTFTSAYGSRKTSGSAPAIDEESGPEKHERRSIWVSRDYGLCSTPLHDRSSESGRKCNRID